MPNQPTTAEIQEYADVWGKLQLQIDKAESAKDSAIEPLTESYNEQVEQVSRQFDTKIAKLKERQQSVEEVVIPWLARKKKDTEVAGEIAVAERLTTSKVWPRVINFLKFMRTIKARGVMDAGIACITIQIGKAEELLGKQTVDAMSHKPTTNETTIQLRLKSEEDQ
jgi:hypothetical protein